jgi:hypothetical protein
MHGRITMVSRKFFSAAVTVAVAAFLAASTAAIAASPDVETGLIKVGDANIDVFAPGRTQELQSELPAAGIPL